MRPVENLPGRQASRALINLLLPRYQVDQHSTGGNRSRTPTGRRSSLPNLPSAGRQKPCQDSPALGWSSEESFSGQLTSENGGISGSPGYRRLGAPLASTAWVLDAAGAGTPPSGGEEGQGAQCGSDNSDGSHGIDGGDGGRGCSGAAGTEGSGEPRTDKGGTGESDAGLPNVAAPPTGIGLVRLLKSTATPGPVPTPGSTVSAPQKPTYMSGKMASVDKYKSQRSESLPSVASSPPPWIGTCNRGGSSSAHDAAAAIISDSPLAQVEAPWGGRWADNGGSLGETWEAFYFYHSGGMKVGEPQP